LEKLIDEHLTLLGKIHDYFGYKESWSVYPLSDEREFFWYMDEDEDQIHFSNSKDNLQLIIDNDFDYEIADADRNDYYTDEVIEVYRAPDYTLVVVDTHTDGNKFLAIYRNIKELKQNETL
jgi:hypothetical protein